MQGKGIKSPRDSTPFPSRKLRDPPTAVPTDIHLSARRDKILVVLMNHKNPANRIIERRAVVYKSNLKYSGVRFVAASSLIIST
jgi:hypothetical protein